MGARYSKDRRLVVEKIKDAALIYKTHFVGKTFLFVFDNRSIEVMFKKTNFRHLTGVATNLSARAFYELALSRKLDVAQISFNQQHPYALCVRKLDKFPTLTHLIKTDCRIVENVATASRTFKFCATDLHITLCMNREYGSDQYYIVESLRDEDCTKRGAASFKVQYIFSKQNDTKLFDTICYQHPLGSYIGIPQPVRRKLTGECYARLFKQHDE